MVFNTTNLFKGIQCPQGSQCVLTSCIFAHDTVPTATTQMDLMGSTTMEDNTPASKRRRLNYESLAEKPSSSLESRGYASPVSKYLPSLTRPVSPPQAKAAQQTPYGTANNGANTKDKISHEYGLNQSKTALTDINSDKSAIVPPPPQIKQESLNPRILANDPAGHNKRSIFLKHLHAAMARLDDMLARSSISHKSALLLTDQELIKLALDQEEQIAKTQPDLYANVIKNRLAAYKKMTLDEWVALVKDILLDKSPQSTQLKNGKEINTGLTIEEELAVLAHFVADQKPLVKHGYNPVPPSDDVAAEAAAAVEASRNYELCDRCNMRFQVFPDRDDEGRLTSNGPCRYHPNRKFIPPRSSTGHREPYYPCCNEEIGSAGCAVQENHVFKASSPGRLAATLQFINTPERDQSEIPKGPRSGKAVRAVCFDCEMGYTTKGMELIRLTAVAWPSGEELLDVLVRPLGIVLDLNSRFSGVWPEHFANAVPYSAIPATASRPPPIPNENGKVPTVLPYVNNPQEARALLCSFLTPKTPLLGHGLENDLNAVRLCHPTIVDTILLFPHNRGPLPLRMGLKALTKRHLGRDIQIGGAAGHDSLEDARATGDLVRFKIGMEWARMKSAGWQINDGQLVEPEPLPRESKPVEAMLEKASSGDGEKRKRRRSGGYDGVDDGVNDSSE